MRPCSIWPPTTPRRRSCRRARGSSARWWQRVSPGTVGLSGFRKQLDTFYGSYIAELQDRGFPIWHPLPFQIPDDREGARHADEFLLGDEMLIAPIYEPGDKRSRLSAARHLDQPGDQPGHAGPRTITVETKSLPVFARNGAIVPLDSSERHGAALLPQTRRRVLPAGGRHRRLLAGARRAGARTSCGWRSNPRRSATISGWSTTPKSRPAWSSRNKQYREVARLEALADDGWFYDAAQKNLHVRVKVKAGEDCIINLNY